MLRLLDDGKCLLIRPLIAILLKYLDVSIARFVHLADAFITRSYQQ